MGDHAFYKCTALKTVNLPDGLEKVGKSAFYKTEQLKTITFPESLDDYAFYQSGLIALDFGDNLTAIGDCAFYGNSALESVSFGKGLKKIGENAFFKALSLTSVVIPDGVEKIEDNAFYGSLSLTQVTIGKGVREIGDYAFYKCGALTTVDFGESVSKIGDYAFVGLNGVKTVFLSSDIDKIGKYAFASAGEATFYTDGGVNKWGKSWNGSYRPVIGGCIVEDGTVVGFVKSGENMSNTGKFGEISPPEKAGCSFVGWSTVKGAESAEYTLDKTSEIPDDTTVYAVFTQIHN